MSVRLGICCFDPIVIDAFAGGKTVERVSFEIERKDVADALREQAASHGRTIEEEVAAVVARGVSAQVPLVDRLIAICGDDSEIYLPARDFMERESVFFNHDFS
jgi:plasmid stability protein